MKGDGALPATRRTALIAAIGAATGLTLDLCPTDAMARSRSDKATPIKRKTGKEGQRAADLGDGCFLNPILSGDRPDPSILKDGADYYAAFSTFVYYPGVVIWHSTDLVNWMPIGPAVTRPIGSIFAVDLAKHGDRYFIYIPVFVPPVDSAPSGPPFKIYVSHALSMHGPWSEPADMDINGFIDPGHVVGEDGKRYLFLNGGFRVRISDDGLRRDGEPVKVYDGWPIPADMIVEGFALEGPKLIRHDGWYYMFSGEGGTAGPPTSHMVVVARTRSINGPWENCPHNPIVHTAHRDEPWWSKGHATPIEGPMGDWWLLYHGYENGRRTLGRQMLLEPFEWDTQGWPRARGGDLVLPLRKPKPNGGAPSSFSLSDDFTTPAFGNRFVFYDPKPDYMDRVRLQNGALHLRGQGTYPSDSSPLTFIAGDTSYNVEISIDLHTADEAGLLLFYNDRIFCGVGLSTGKLHAYKVGQEQLFPPAGPASARRLTIQARNDDDVVTFSYTMDGSTWIKIGSFEVSGYNHNMGDGFLSLRPAIFATGKGEAVFENLQYRGG